ncbi:FtsX-like permease family protein [Cellulomonas sp. WB94]|uniref:ABC transporter permease n=1 Tax=Cellulomonas sp. WB94 TaxID=2173174 RepID=UPI001F5B6288|nr:FtsX-like permease family protein [Cellulomonas sp. WB94]
MRRSIGRLVAAGVAIAIGTAFVAATLLAGGVMTRSTYDTVTARYAQADLVVTQTVDDTQLAAIRAVPGVDAADPVPLVGVELHNGGVRVWVHAAPTTTDPRLDAQVVSAGALPAAPGQIALPVAVAQRLAVGVGDHLVTPQPVLVTSHDPSSTAAPTDTWTTVDETLTVVGLLDDPHHAYAQLGGAAAVTAADAARWGGAGSLAGLDGPVLVALAPGTDLGAMSTTIRAAVPDAEVSTRDEAAKAQIAELSSEAEVLTGIVLGFAAVALVVAALVIANTFQVLVAQRTRTLALLRCVGADRGQLRRSVLVEAAILGAAASLVGLAVGIALAQGALMVLGRMELGVPLPTAVTVTSWVVLVPVVLGTAVTLLAALVPARAATRVAPIEALRPSDAPAVGERAGRARLVIAAVLSVGGLAALLAGVPLSLAGQPLLGLAVAVLGGAVSFVGVLVGAVFWIPRVVALVGRGLARTGTSARLAAANTARNPRRTAATSSALLIGVTLVALMSAGAASTRVTLDNDLDTHYPVDLTLEATAAADGSIDAMPSDVAPTIADVAGVAQVTEMRVTAARISTAGHPADPAGAIHLRSISPADLAAVVRTPDLPAALDDDTIVIGPVLATRLGVGAGDRVDVAAYTGFADDSTPSPGGQVTTLTVAVAGTEGWAAFVTTTIGRTVAPAAPVAELWVRLADVNDAGSVVPRVQDAIRTAAVSVDGPALQRASYQTLISTLLAVVVGLLAVAVVIALVGVANTLSLSVLERRRESATLRAIGLSRRQLRWMLAIEGMLIAGIGAVLGTLLGLLYGWVGAATVLSTVGPVTLAVPWRDVVIVLVVAVAAGLAASVVPGRAAARTSPVAALTVD